MGQSCITSQNDEERPLSLALERALKAVEELGAFSLTVVPNIPTSRMLAEGARAGSISEDAAFIIYDAMLNAIE